MVITRDHLLTLNFGLNHLLTTFAFKATEAQCCIFWT